MKRRRGPGLRKTRYERGVELKRNKQLTLGATLIAVDIAMKKLNFTIDRAVDLCQPRASGSVVGSTVQTSDLSPAHEDAFVWLETVRKELEELVTGGPF